MRIPLTTITALAGELHGNLTGRKVTAVRDLGSRAGLCLSIASGKQGPCLALATWPDLFVPFLCPQPAAKGSSEGVSHILERHLRGQTIQSVASWRHDRIIRLETIRIDEIRGPIGRTLILELVPRRQNVILLDSDSQMVLFSLRRVDGRISRLRQVLPGKPYQPPPSSPGLHPDADSEENFMEAFGKTSGHLLREKLHHLFPWASPYLFDEILRSMPLPSEACEITSELQRSIWSHLHTWFDRLEKGPPSPTVILDDGRQPAWLLPYDPVSVPEDRKRPYGSLSQALEDLFRRQTRLTGLKSKKTNLLHQINLILRRHRRARKHLGRDAGQAQRAEEFQRAGVMLTAHLSRLRKGSSRVSLPDPTDPTRQVDISLDPKLTPSENAQRYFKRYRKAKAALPKVRHQLGRLDEEIESLTALRKGLAQASDLEEVQSAEVRFSRWVAKPQMPSDRSGRGRAGKNTVGRKYTLPDGWTVLVGRNNKENDQLTHRVARSDDLWLHAQGVPGSHVVIRREGRKDLPGRGIMELAAGLAAHFSRSRHSGTVPVIVTEKRYVRKPKGAKPGVAAVEHEKTLFVTPLAPERLAEDMKK